MTRKISGTITDSSAGGAPVEGLRVQAWDDDWPDGDDFMGEATTGASGQYRISYADAIWDDSLLDVVSRRPDIYISVDIRNGDGEWIRLAKSGVFRNHDLTEDLEIDLGVNLGSKLVKHTAFDPAVHGFKFRNLFTLEPDVLGIDLGSWQMGFCGGMCAGALHRFRNGIPIPDDDQPPADGTPLFEELFRRQMKSTPLDSLPQLYDWQSAPEAGVLWRKPGIGQRTKKEWPKLKSALDRDQPTIISLIRANGYFDNPTKNHQVLAVGYEYDPAAKDLVIFTYDPNRPGRTSRLAMSLGLPEGRLHLKDTSRSRTRGFLVNAAGEGASA